jgi:exodeoxyribonuclease VII large subunit
MRPDEPPEWALPSWDDIEGIEPPSGTSRRDPARTPAPPGTFGLRVLTVSEVTRTIRGVVTADQRLRDVWVEGEVGRVTISSAGHAYFALRDERNQLQCVWFRDERLRSSFEARTGFRVVAHGRIDLYEPTGALQLYVEALQPAGFGDLTIRLEELKARLSREGLFGSDRKRPLPERPSVIAVVTSPSGAVWHDIRTVLARRWPLATVLLSPCQVQGEAAPASIVGALERVARQVTALRADGRAGDAPAVTILARGGGSLEDLWSFNDEAVVRAVVRHPVPVVCGVGHEVDTTLTDFAADVRAATPSAAAELVVPDRLELAAALAALRGRLDRIVALRLDESRTAVAAERRALERLDPRAQLVAGRERVGLLLDRATAAAVALLARERLAAERLAGRLAPTLPGRIGEGRAVLAAGAAALGVLGPQATLDRGYAIARRTADGAIVRDPDEAQAGTGLRLRVARGEIPVTVDRATGPGGGGG